MYSKTIKYHRSVTYQKQGWKTRIYAGKVANWLCWSPSWQLAFELDSVFPRLSGTVSGPSRSLDSTLGSCPRHEHGARKRFSLGTSVKHTCYSGYSNQNWQLGTSCTECEYNITGTNQFTIVYSWPRIISGYLPRPWAEGAPKPESTSACIEI